MTLRLALLTMALALSLDAQVLRLAELNTTQITALDRAKTVVLMPGGTMEEHGPYLPSFSDGFMNEWWCERLAELLVEKGYVALIYPTIPLGDGGANEIGKKFAFPGSYGVRVSTLRAVYMDLGTELGEQGFRWIFIIQNHGSPVHNLVLDQAGDYFHDTYGGEMVNLTGLEPAGHPAPPAVDAGIAKVNGIDIHAGLSESSRILFIKPDLVDPAIRNARPYTALSDEDLLTIASADGWPGYFGAPHHATAAHGAGLMRHRFAIYSQTALAILGGANPRAIPRYSTAAMKAEKATMDASLAYDESVRKRQADWMKKNGIE